jgi:hypothetical protein
MRFVKNINFYHWVRGRLDPRLVLPDSSSPCPVHAPGNTLGGDLIKPGSEERGMIFRISIRRPRARKPNLNADGVTDGL